MEKVQRISEAYAQIQTEICDILEKVDGKEIFKKIK